MIDQSHFCVAFQRTLLLSLVLLSLGNRQGNAQIVPDETLGSERSTINSINPQRSQIDGGAVRGSNLFHSFQEFNVSEGTSVYFSNPVGIENILSRVTGGNPSNIFGQLGVLGEANLFLINPNGIIFGPNASLDLRGSFLATTADSIRLGENGEFSATQPDGNSLLTVHPSALWFNHLTPNSIINQSTANGVGLQVPTGETLGLIGGNIMIDGGILTAEQGRIELGSVGNHSAVQLNSIETGLTLDYSDVGTFQDIQLNNTALVDVSGEGSGNIQVRGQQVFLSGGSGILANTFGSQTGGQLNINAEHLILSEGGMISSAVFGEGLGANLEINAQQMTLTGGILTEVPFPGTFLTSEGQQITGIFSSVQPGATGNGGDIDVNTQSLTITDGAQIKTITAGVGNSGTITVRADHIEAVGVLSDASGGLRTDVFPGATGNGGDLNVEAERIILRDGGQISSAVLGAGRGGNVTITATELLEASGTALSQSEFPQLSQLLELFNGQFPTGVLTTVFLGATGDGGDLTVNAPRITLNHGGLIGTGTISATGNSGDLKLQAHEINIIGTSPDEFFPSSVFTSVIFGATGKGGNLTIDTQILNLRDGGQVRAGTSGIGDSGNITIQASDINLNGSSGDGQFPSSILADVDNLSEIAPDAIGSGKGGNILIETDRLTLRDGGQVSAGTFGRGTGGNLEINATERIEATGISADGELVSGLFNSVGAGGSGDGGNATINTPQLSLTEGGRVSARVFGSGQGGDITVNANVIEVIGAFEFPTADPQQPETVQASEEQIPSRISALVTPEAIGNGGDITINTQQLTVQEGAALGTGTTGAGDSGNLRIQAEEVEVSGVASTGFPNSIVFTSAFSGRGNGGNLTLETDRLSLRDGGQIRAGTSGMGNSGDVMVRANTIELIGRSPNGQFPSSILTSVEDLSFVNPAAIGSGNAGNLLIESDRITLTDGAEITASTSGRGQAGTISINAPDIQLDNSLISVNSSANATGTVGGMTVETETLRLTHSAIETVTFGSNDAGNITVNATDIEATGLASDPQFPMGDSQFFGGLRSIVATGATGGSGDITVNTQQLTLQNSGSVGSFVRGAGQGGNLNINAVEIDILGTITGYSQDLPFSGLLSILNDQFPTGLSTTVLPGANGNGGNMTVKTQRLTVRESGSVGAGTFSMGNSGDVTIQANEIEVIGSNGVFPFPSLIFTSVLFGGSGQGGNLTIDTQHLTLQDGAQIRAGTSGSGNSGDVTIQANDIELIGRSPDGFFGSSILTSVEDLSIVSPEAIGSGDAGNLFVESDRITVEEGASISTSTFGSGQAGNLLIDADTIQLNTGGSIEASSFGTGQGGQMRINANEIEVTGIAPDGEVRSSIATQSMFTGDGGNLILNTERLTLRDGGLIQASVFGSGAGGTIEVNAAEITAIGTATGSNSLPQVQALLQSLDNQYPSGLLTTVIPGGTGQGGDLTVNAQRITLQDGAQIGAGTFGAGNSGNLRVRANDIEISGAFLNDQLPSSFFTSVFLNERGNGGNLTVEAQNIRLQDGGQIRAGTSSQGQSGNITVRANNIELSGRSGNGQLPSSIRAGVEDFSEISLGRGEGNGGNVSIESDRITLTNGAEITASSFTEGAAGSVGINANLVQLDQGVISAETLTGDRGNITLNAQQVNLRNNSSITTNAMEEATGGNLTLNTQLLTARDKSQITASAVIGQGGNIQINANGVFLDNTSLITASSELGVDGRVEVNSLVDPSEAVVKLSPIVINLDTILAQKSCVSDNQIAQGSSFVITGRGGLPPNPRRQLRSLRGIVEWESAKQPTQEAVSEPATIPTSVVVVRRQVREIPQVRQAQGWVRTPEGTMILTAEPTTVQPQNSGFVPPNCQQ